MGTGFSPPLPRFAGVTCPRNLLFGAETPGNLVRLILGLGIREASLAIKSNGSKETGVVPSRACLIVIFGQKYSRDANGKKQKNYYVTESVSISTGLLLAALHHAGLSTLTHTPRPMKFLNKILERPDTEKPLMILVAGYAARPVRVPDITRKSLEQISSYHE